MPPRVSRRTLLASASVSLALAACGRKAGDPRTGSAILLRGNGPDPDSLDPHRARSTEAMTVLRDLFECLTRLDARAAPVPAAAEGWTVSEDGKVYTFGLRPGLRWSNGDALVAEDFAAGLRRLVDPATASQYAQVVDVIVNAPEIVAGKQPPAALGVAAPDDRTVMITLSSPAPYLPGLMAHPSCAPLHRPSLSLGDRFARAGSQVSNGAFVLEEWLQGSYILAARNTRYWNNGANKLDGVRYLQIGDENAELRAYRAGELHCTNVVPRGQFDWIKENLAAELHVSPQLSTYYFGFNLDRTLFKDSRLRQALSMAVDRERLSESVLRLGEMPAWSWVPPGVLDYSPQKFPYADLPRAERLESARRMLAEAGYTREKPLKFELRYNTGEVHNKVAVAVASMWKEALGVEATLAAVEFQSLFADVERRNVDVFRFSWVGDYNDPYTFLQYLKSNFGINLPGYRNPAYDALLEEAARQTEPPRRRELLQRAEALMLADHPLIPLYFYTNKHLVKPELRGWYDNVMNVVYSQDLSLA